MALRRVYLNNRPWQEVLAEYLQVLQEKSVLDVATEWIPVEHSLGRVTAEPVMAKISSPHYRASAMDGVAVRSSETLGASETTPIRLELGQQAVEVDTGDPVPEGMDAVIMVEDIHYPGDGTVEITAAASPWQHVRSIGEDVVATEMILPANHRIRPYDLGGMLAGGNTEVKVYVAPRVAIIPTGTELVQPGSPLRPGDIIEYNSHVLGGMVTEWGGVPRPYPITADNYDQLKQRVQEAVERHDLVIINAGSSAGREDFTAALIEELGELFAHGVAVKPGKPVMLGIVARKPVIGVPGYPVSAAVTFELFAKPIIYRMQGLVPPARERVQAHLSRRLHSVLGAEEFVRVKLGRVGGKLVATPMSRGAGVIMSLVKADGVLRVPLLSEGIEAGETVDVELLRPLPHIEESTVIIGSHDITLDILADCMQRFYPGRFISSAHVGSLGGIMALKRGEAHCAGLHLLDENTGEYNVSYVQRYLPDRDMVLVNLAYREQGLIVQKGNPQGINGVKDLTKPGIQFINRQAGAGTRILLDYLLKQEEISARQISGYQREEFTHLAVAAAVASGAADAAMGILAAAKAFNLDFIPLTKERYDLCIPLEYWELPQIKLLLEVIRSAEFRRQAEKLGGYDLSQCGQVVWASKQPEGEKQQ